MTITLTSIQRRSSQLQCDCLCYSTKTNKNETFVLSHWMLDTTDDDRKRSCQRRQPRGSRLGVTSSKVYSVSIPEYTCPSYDSPTPSVFPLIVLSGSTLATFVLVSLSPSCRIVRRPFSSSAGSIHLLAIGRHIPNFIVLAICVGLALGWR
jgi:hypothetical protein